MLLDGVDDAGKAYQYYPILKTTSECKGSDDNIQSGSYLEALTSSKKVNVRHHRLLYDDASTGRRVTWDEYLAKIDSMFPNKLLVPYVCHVDFESVRLCSIIGIMIISIHAYRKLLVWMKVKLCLLRL